MAAVFSLSQNQCPVCLFHQHLSFYCFMDVRVARITKQQRSFVPSARSSHTRAVYSSRHASVRWRRNSIGGWFDAGPLRTEKLISGLLRFVDICTTPCLCDQLSRREFPRRATCAHRLAAKAQFQPDICKSALLSCIRRFVRNCVNL